MYNIQKAVSRLDYAPKLKEIEITDIKKGLGVFAPQPDKPVSFAALRQTLKKAGYVLDTADIIVAGKIVRDGDRWFVVASLSEQRFLLEGQTINKLVEEIEPDSSIEITGRWKTVGDEKSAQQEVIENPLVKKIGGAEKTADDVLKREQADSPTSRVNFTPANFSEPPAARFVSGEKIIKAEKKPLAPIRTTSPGLTVFQGGAITPRVYFVKQHLGELDVSRQVLDLSVSYTPTPKLQLELEVPFSRTSFDDGDREGAGGGLGNITLWGKYRFFRTVKTYGDRQAAARFGLELPTGKSGAPGENALNASAFVREQLSPINGGLSPHFDIAFSQAGGRFIFGGNVEGIWRTERDGFRLGNELRVNTDVEYVLLPLDYEKPGKELFVILESTFLVRGRGRVRGEAAAGSASTEFYLAPGLQYAAAPRFVIEGSLQLPVFRNSGAQVLRTDFNLLLGVKYLF